MDFILFGGNDASPTSGDPASAQPRNETLSEDVISSPSKMVGESSPTSDKPALSLSLDKVSPTVPTRVCK